MNNIYRLARFLGWFSVVLGLTELFGAGSLDQFLGTNHREKTLRFFGLRELLAGVGILSRARPGPVWLWARVAGDTLDLSALGVALESNDTKRDHVVIATAAVVGVTALDVYCAWKLTQDRGSALAA